MSMERWGKGGIYLRGSTYWIRFPDGSGGQRRESAGRDPGKAADLLARRIVELEDDRLPAKSRERKKTVNDLLDALVADLKAREKRSVKDIASNLKNIRKTFGHKRASSVTKAALTAYVVERREAGFAEGTISKELRLFGQAFRLQKAVPVPEFPQNPKGAVRDVLIQPAEAQQLCASFTDSVHRDIAEFYFCSGWRGHEIRNLKWENVREDTIRLVEQFSKTGEARDFPIFGQVREILERRQVARLPFSSWVFQRAGKPIGYRAYLNAWKRAAKKAGLGLVNPHDARRSFVTTAVDSGIDPQVARTLSGHRSNAIFERYRIIQTETLRQAVERREQYVESRTNQRKVVSLTDRKVARNSHNSETQAPKSNAGG
jgi:integrase